MSPAKEIIKENRNNDDDINNNNINELQSKPIYFLY